MIVWCVGNLSVANDHVPGSYLPSGATDDSRNAASVAVVDNTPVQPSQMITIVYEKGLVPVAVANLPQREEVVTGSTLTVSNMNVSVPGYVLIGWHTITMPFVINTTFETTVKSLPTFYGIGSSFIVPNENLTLYAVWSLDVNNNGMPDYVEQSAIPTPNSRAGTRSQTLAPNDEPAETRSKAFAPDGSISLRSAQLPAWKDHFDQPALYDSIYYTNCFYNTDYDNYIYESLIYLNPIYTFNAVTVNFSTEMNFVIECDGVLTENSLISGKTLEPLRTIKVTTDMINRGFSLDSLFRYDPFMFTSIKEDGLAVLKMYFTDPVTNAHPNISQFALQSSVDWPKPFKNPETGAFTDTLVIKFYIYDKPEFESEIISQYVDTRGYIDLNHKGVGTPLKYMMRSINGLSWQPATAPLTTMEQIAVTDSANIYLREMDKTIAYQNFLKNFYLSDDYFNSNNFAAEWVSLLTSFELAYSDSIWEADIVTDPSNWSVCQSTYDIFSPSFGHSVAANTALTIHALSINPSYSQVTAEAYANAKTVEYWPVLGQQYSDAVIIPDPCREVITLKFNTILPPVIKRYVEIQTIEGVTANPGAGEQHFVDAQDDFTFTLTFAGGKPLKVIATGIYSQLPAELEGTALGDGTFRYVIRQISEPWTVTISPEPASQIVTNEAVKGLRVWAHASTLYLDSDKAVRANIYTLSGALFKQLNASAGTTRVQLAPGLYIVETEGAHYKVVVR
jgi:hypothetical protein